MSLYNIYGFVVSIEGPLDDIFSKEYTYFMIDAVPRKTDLFVKSSKAEGDFSIKLPERTLARTIMGKYIPFREGENTLWYNKGVDCNSLIYYCEWLMWWPDKTRLHAGAVTKNGRSFIFTGGGGVGKTSCVLNLLKNGYDYLSDDWLIIGGNMAFPLPKRIHIFDYNLSDAEIAKRALGWKRFHYKLMCKLCDWGSRYALSKYSRFAFKVLKPKYLSIKLQKLYPESKVASPSKISKIFYLERRNINKIKIETDITSKELARRMAYVNMYEWNDIFKEYYKYVYLFGIRNERIENKLYHELKLMHETFKDAEIYRVIIPKNIDLTKVKLTSLLELD